MITNDVAVVVTQHWQSNTSQNREPDCAACFAENQLLEPRTANQSSNCNPSEVLGPGSFAPEDGKERGRSEEDTKWHLRIAQQLSGTPVAFTVIGSSLDRS